MTKTNLQAIPLTVFEEGDREARHDFTLLWQTAHYDFDVAHEGDGLLFFPCEHAITTLTIIDDDLAIDGIVDSRCVRGALDPCAVDAEVRDMVTDTFYDRDEEPEKWELTRDSLVFGATHDLTNPF